MVDRPIACPSCGSTDDAVPVWEGDTIDGEPDYVGCLSCHEMKRVE